MQPTDLTKYSLKHQIQLINANGKVPQKIPSAKNWEEVEQIIDSIAIVSAECKEHYKKKFIG